MADTFKGLRAAELFCPRCKTLRPVRDRLLLVLPGLGEKHDLFCAVCGETVGDQLNKDAETSHGGLIVP